MINLLGAKIRRLRKEKGYTLEKLAELTDSSKSYIWELENKKEIPNPTTEKLASIASKLDLTIDYLVEATNDDPSENVLDEAFFREYQKMSAATKERIRKMLGIMGDDE